MCRTARALVSCVGVLVLCGCVGTRVSDSAWKIESPYAGINWKRTGRYKANLHTHTKNSDGSQYPHEVVDRYKKLGYEILAITDHDKLTYPWTAFSKILPDGVAENRNPEKLRITDIPGNELSMHNHMGSLLSDYLGTPSLEESLEGTKAKKGITVLCHPGRYPNAIDWYVDLFSRYDHLLGIEIYNQGDRHPDDRQKWDSILSRTLPGRQVWGFSADDTHLPAHIGRNWNIFLLPKCTRRWFRRGMEQGRFFYVYAPEGHAGPKPPVINALSVLDQKGMIAIDAEGYDRIEWISEGKKIHTGEVLNLESLDDLGRYVRAEVHGKEGGTVVGTQPILVSPRHREFVNP